MCVDFYPHILCAPNCNKLFCGFHFNFTDADWKRVKQFRELQLLPIKTEKNVGSSLRLNHFVYQNDFSMKTSVLKPVTGFVCVHKCVVEHEFLWQIRFSVAANTFITSKTVKCTKLYAGFKLHITKQSRTTTRNYVKKLFENFPSSFVENMSDDRSADCEFRSRPGYISFVGVVHEMIYVAISPVPLTIFTYFL